MSDTRGGAPPGKAAPRTVLSSAQPFSIVTVAMNRTEHLLQTAPRLAAWPCHAEHLVVDWSSATPIRREQLPADPRLRLLRVEGERQWCLSRAYNFAVQQAAQPLILKLDADCWVADPSAPWSPLPAGCYRRTGSGGGLNGLVLIRRSDFFAVGGFHELLCGYGFDDKDLYQRLERQLECERFTAGLFATLEHGDGERVAAGRRERSPLGAELGAIAAMEASKAVNRLLAQRQPWGPQQPRCRYRPLATAGPGAGDRWQLEPGSLPRAPAPLGQEAADLGLRCQLALLLGVPERWLERRFDPGALRRLARWLPLLQQLAGLRAALLAGGLRLLLRLDRLVGAISGLDQRGPWS